MPLPLSTFNTETVSGALKQAVEAGRAKQAVTRTVFDNVDARTRLEAFTAAGNHTEKTISVIQSKVHNAIENGTSFEDFKKSLTPELLARTTAPDLVYENAINNAYHRARYESQRDIKTFKPFLRYVTFGDDRVRPNHKILNGRVSRQDDPFWSLNYPPNGHRCRCTARAVSNRDLDRLGLTSRTMGQIEQDANNEQARASVPETKRIRPLADKGWRASFRYGEPMSEALIKDLRKFETASYFCIETPSSVGKEVFKQPLSLKNTPPGRALSAKEAVAEMKMFTHNVNMKGIGLDSLNEINATLYEAKELYGLKKYVSIDTAMKHKYATAEASGAVLRFNRELCHSTKLFEERAAKTVVSIAKNKDKIKEIEAALATYETKIQEAIQHSKVNNIPLNKNYVYMQTKKIKREYEEILLRLNNTVVSSVSSSTLANTTVHEIGHSLLAQKEPNLYDVLSSGVVRSKRGGLSKSFNPTMYNILVPAKLEKYPTFKKYNIDKWFSDPSHQKIRREVLGYYSNTNAHEYLAESFSAYHQGKTIHPDVKAFIEERLIK